MTDIDPWAGGPATPARRGAPEGGPCSVCGCPGGAHWIEERCCDCRGCSGYRVDTARYHVHRWSRYSAEEAQSRDGFDVVACDGCGRFSRQEHDVRALLTTPHADILQL